MTSMFGGFGSMAQLSQGAVQGSPGPSSGPGGGGFPGIFPGGGVSNSGFAGFAGFDFGNGSFGKVGPCTQEDLRTGACVMGPRMEFLGKR